MKLSMTLVSSVLLGSGLTADAVFAADTPAASHASAVAPVPGSHPELVSQAWVRAEANKMAKSSTLSMDGVVAAARQKLAAGGATPSNADINALVLQVLQKVSEDAAAELRTMQDQMKAAADKRKAMREDQKKIKDQKDSLSEMSQSDQLRLQQLMDRKSKLEQMISNVMKTSSDTQSAVSKNIK